MDEDIAIVNQNTRVSLLKDFFKKNSKKIIISLSIIFIALLIFFVFDELKKRKKEKLAQLYNGIIFNTNQYEQNDIKNKMIKIVNEKVDTYSALALYYLIDNKLVDDQNKISEYFDQVISISDDKELKNLIIFKKALYFSDKYTEIKLLEILNPLINSDSIWKQHGLLLMGDFYYQKKEFNKSKEFFEKITELSNINPKIKTDVERRLNRDFNE
ncbi:tetratricopeptide repeat protein [Candidatus Pelagibacter communis]|uniref:tetratricopeptide repeat protein n=1 Tax=Pelagibacter ubique TaxID=198252 RepID=UPI00094C2287|nr:tetratricopeptide repeat protein [Candidatus Pelagibacter ubique]